MTRDNQDYLNGYDIGRQGYSIDYFSRLARELQEQDEKNGIEHDPTPYLRGYRSGRDAWMFLKPR